MRRNQAMFQEKHPRHDTPAFLTSAQYVFSTRCSSASETSTTGNNFHPFTSCTRSLILEDRECYTSDLYTEVMQCSSFRGRHGLHFKSITRRKQLVAKISNVTLGDQMLQLFLFSSTVGNEQKLR